MASPSKLALFGATGKTGAHLIDESIRRGFAVTVFVRNGSAFEDSRVTAIHGDLLDQGLVEKAIDGSTAVLSALGPTHTPHPRGRPITAAMATLVSSMERVGVKRLIAVSTGTAPDPGDAFDFKIRAPAVLLRTIMRPAYDDMLGLAETIRASNLEWTMVRAAVLNDKAATHRLNVGLYGHTHHSFSMSRADLAYFMLDQVGSQDQILKAPGLSERR